MSFQEATASSQIGQVLKENPVITISDKDVSGIELVAIDTETVTRQQGLELIWSVSGRWQVLAINEKAREIFAANGRNVAAIDATGKTIREFSGTAFPSSSIQRRAQMSASGDYALLAFSSLQQLTAYSPGGQIL